LLLNTLSLLTPKICIFLTIRDDCENDLAEAIPALQSAVTSLDTLNAGDITVVKTMKNPAPIVKFVVESVCVMKGVLPDRKPGMQKKILHFCGFTRKKICTEL
jgi:dynein heavy chain